jgi:hypothetical protein
MAVKVLAWRFDHVGDCNRYGNCVVHPYFERPTIAELVDYPARLPNESAGLQYVPSDVVTEGGRPEPESQPGLDVLRERANILRAAVGEALHRIQRGHGHEAELILDRAITDFDRVWSFAPVDKAPSVA